MGIGKASFSGRGFVDFVPGRDPALERMIERSGPQIIPLARRRAIWAMAPPGSGTPAGGRPRLAPRRAASPTPPMGNGVRLRATSVIQ